MIARTLYLNRLISHRDNQLVKVITGMRRCGKSTLLQLYRQYLLNNGVDEQNIITMNFELMEFDSIRDYKTLYQMLKEKLLPADVTYLLLDEIQEVEQWERAINSLNVEGEVDIYVTGSNAHLLSSEISTLLAGRYAEIKMLPLSFQEYLQFDHLPDNLSLEDKLNQYIRFGSLPTVASLPQDSTTVNEFLEGVYNTVVVKDVVARSKSRDTALLERIVRFVASNAGSIVSPNKISGYLSAEKGVSVKSTTVDIYLSLLAKVYIVYPVQRYDVKGRELLSSLQKYYISDTGIRNMILGYNAGDYGHIIETLVYFELLRRGFQVYTGKLGKYEIDFVAVRPGQKLYVQVTQSLIGELVFERELRPLQEITDHYEKYVISMDKHFATDHEGIKLVNLIDFLLDG